MAQGRITYGADGDYVDKQLKEFTLTQEVIEKLDSIEPGAERNYIQGIKVNGEPQTPDQYRVVDLSIPEVEDTLSSYDNTAALSARQGRVLYNYIKDLQQVGHFLSNWNCATGLPQTNPQTNPYVYNTGDYFIVSNVSSGTNYKPNGSQYIIGQASITVESDEVKVGDFYVYDGTDWLLLINTERQIAIDTSLSTTSTNPVENRVITNALNLKANDADISTVGKTNDYNDIDNLPSIPDSLDDLSGDSDDIIEGSAHLFLTPSERTNLSHQSGVNTGDENQGSIKQKLGAASSSSDGYLTSTDRSTFNDKQDEISDLSDIRNNATAGKNASDTIATYGDVVTHDTNEFATAAQGGKADTALQSGDNVSELVNDAGYITDAYHDDTKQDKLVAGANIQIAADGKTISATDTTYVAGDFDIKDLADNTGLRTEWSGKQDELIAGSNIQIAADGKTISATDTIYTAGDGINISNNNVISAIDNKAAWGSIEGTLSNQTDLQSALDTKQDDMVILKYGISTWNDFITAYNKNAVVYCRASSQSNPASGAQTRLAFMAYVNQETNPTSVEFQYYRSRSDHNSAANQLDQVFVYQLTSSNGGTWSVIERNTAAKATAGTGINLTYGSGNMTIANTGVTSVNSQTGDVTITIPTNVSDFVNDAGYITANDLPTVDTSMSDSSTNAVQNKVIKSYVDTQVQEATAGAVSDTAYGSDWNGVTGIAPSKNAVYDKISVMDTTISGKQDTISDLATIRTGAGKGATAIQPGDNLSTLTNDAGFITKAVNDLTNYYTKSETYTKSEVADYVANFAGFKVVSTLPTTDIKTTIIYLLGPIGSGADKYEEWIYSNNAWVKIGETTVDLTNYAQKTEVLTLTNTTSYTPTANYHPATKKYVDDGLAGKQASLTAGENIEINGNVISADNLFIITENDVTVSTTDEYGVAPYNTSYYYTNIEISANAGIKWVEGAVYCFVINTTMVVSGDYRNVRVRIGTNGDWKPVMNASNTIMAGSSYFTKARNDLYVYKTTHQSNGALHMNNDTSYSVMSATEGKTGTATGARTMRADYLKQIIKYHAVDDTAYASSRDGKTDIAPSKNAVYDKISAMDTTIAGKADSSSLASYVKKSDSSQQTIAVTSGTTALGVKSASSNSSYISYSGTSWLASLGVRQSGNKVVPTLYDGDSHDIAYVSDLPTVNNSTITYTQAGDTITTTTTNQSSASTVALRGDIFVTQAEYNNLPSTKTTDGNTYIIYKT